MSVDQVSDSCDSYDLTISIKKGRGGLSTSSGEVLQGAHHYSERSKIASGRQVRSPTLEAHCQDSCTLMHIDDEVNARFPKANSAFSRLRGSVWD